jgi:hypothetical protein
VVSLPRSVFFITCNGRQKKKTQNYKVGEKLLVIQEAEKEKTTLHLNSKLPVHNNKK